MTTPASNACGHFLSTSTFEGQTLLCPGKKLAFGGGGEFASLVTGKGRTERSFTFDL